MIATGGGTYRPLADRHAFFLASRAGILDIAATVHPWILVAVNEVRTDAEIAAIERVMDLGGHVLLDSGIFWLTNQHARAHGVTMDQALSLHPTEVDGFQTLWDRYLALVRRWEDRLWGYIELDQGGIERKRETRAALHSEGLRPIPVYHPLLDGWDYFDELASTHDRICFGNIVMQRPAARLRLLYTMWKRRQKYPHLWIHVLGMSPTHFLFPFPSSSCDSSSWLSSHRWAQGHYAYCIHPRYVKQTAFRYAYGESEQHDMAFNLAAWESSFQNRIWREWLQHTDNEWPKEDLTHDRS